MADWHYKPTSGPAFGTTFVPTASDGYHYKSGVVPQPPKHPAEQHQESGGGGGFLSGIEHIGEAALGQGSDIIHGIPGAIASAPHTLAHTFGPQGANEDTGISWIDRPFHAIGLVQGHHKAATSDPQSLVGQTYMGTAPDVVALRRGDWHYFAKHPLNPLIDIATVASLGGRAALVGARTGALGERAAQLAESERVLKVGGHREALNQARTLQGRIRQRAFDKLSMKNPDLRVIGAHVRMKKILDARVATQTLRAHLPVREFQRLTHGLRPAEVFGFHVAAEGVPLEDRIGYYRAQLAEHPTKALRVYLQNLESPDVRAALENPRPEFVAAVHAGKALEAKAGERLVATGQLSEQTRAERAALPQREMLGGDITAGIREDISRVEARMDSARREGRTADLNRDQSVWDRLMKELESPERPPPELGRNLVHPAFPAPYRFAHVANTASPARLFTSPKTERMLGKAAPLHQLRHNAAERLSHALFHTDPERVLTTDYLQTVRHETILQTQKESLDPISKELSAEDVATGFKKPGEWYYRPSYDRKTTAPIPRDVREMQSLNQDRAMTNAAVARDTAESAASGIVAKNLHGLGIDPKDAHSLERLNELGICRVPGQFGKGFSQEFGGTSAAVRLLYDRPLDVWRAITLNYRPAWIVSNFVGNGIMGLARYGPQGAAIYLRMLLATERGDAKVRQLWRFTMKHPTLRRKYADVFNEVAPQLHSAGLYGTQTRITQAGVYEGRLAGFTANPAVRKLGFVPKKVGRAVMAVGRGVTKVEVLLAEDTGREAAFIREAGGDLAKIRATAKSMGEGNLSLAEALKRLDQGSVEQAVRGVNDALGDFNDLNHFERSVVRRLIPFYGWFKVLTKVSAKYVARYPLRIQMLQAIEKAQDRKGEPPLPDWLSGSILVGKPHKGVQTLLSTQGINPYETINQIASGGAGSVLSPFANAAAVGLTGVDPTFGKLEPYHGLGANKRGGWSGQAEMAAGSLVSGLAPARLYTQTTQPYKGKLYAPRTYGHAGPLSINDFLLQYLGIPVRHVKLDVARQERGLK